MHELIPELHRATHRVAKYIDDALPGINQGEAQLLAHLHLEMECRVESLHKALGHKRSTLTSLLNRLQKRGLITRDAVPRDKRGIMVRPTKAGQQAARRASTAFVNLELSTTKRVTRAQLEACLAVLKEIGTY